MGRQENDSLIPIPVDLLLGNPLALIITTRYTGSELGSPNDFYHSNAVSACIFLVSASLFRNSLQKFILEASRAEFGCAPWTFVRVSGNVRLCRAQTFLYLWYRCLRDRCLDRLAEAVGGGSDDAPDSITARFSALGTHFTPCSQRRGSNIPHIERGPQATITI